MAPMTVAMQTDGLVKHRREGRKPLVGNIVLWGSSGDNGVTIEGITANVSKSGACVYICQEISEGESFTVYGKAIGTSPRIACIVWCRQIAESIFKIGISLE